MARAKKYFEIATFLYFSALIIDTISELLYVKSVHSNSIHTLFGLTIYNKITRNGFSFSLNIGIKALLIYLIFVGIVLLSVFLVERWQNKFYQ